MSAAHRDVRVFIVEDEPSIASSLRIQLGLLGYGETRWAQDRLGALALIEEEQPDLVIMDVHLADGDDGASVAKELRQRWNIPSVFLTAHTDDATIERCKEAEPAGYLLKPFSLQLLKVTLEMALHREGAVRARAEAEQRTRRTESLYRAIFENAPVAILSVSSEGTIVKANPAALHLFASDATDLTGSDIHSLLQEPPPRQHGLTHYTTAALRQDERAIPVAVCALTFGYEGEELTNYFLSDLRERLALEDQLAHAHQSDALAAVTSGVAHDLNNLLGSLQTLQFLLEQQRGNTLPLPVMALEQVVERGAWLTDQLVQLGHHTDDEEQTLNLGDYLQTSSHLFRRLLGDARTVVVPDQTLNCYVRASPHKLRRALVQILRNARQATAEDGCLRVSLAHCGDSSIELRISDNGVGMPADVSQRAFEPFFSTRTDDEAHGLGLAIVRRTIESLGGTVGLDSHPGRGTTVVITLPLARPALTQPVQRLSGDGQRANNL